MYPLLRFPDGAGVENSPADAGDVRNEGSVLGQEDPLQKGEATHASNPAWRIPCAEEPGGPQSMGSQGQTQLDIHAHRHTLMCKIAS